MPVKWLLYWQPNIGAIVSSPIFTELCKCVEGINGVREGRWAATLHQYRPILKDEAQRAECARDYLEISFEENPSNSYFVIRTHRIVLEADSKLPSILDKLQAYRRSLTVNFEGYQYQLGDFRIKMGKVSVAEAIKGIVMEVEYVPICSLEKTHALMGEFFDLWQDAISGKSLSGHFINVDVKFPDYSLPDHYSWQHTAVLYCTVMVQVMSVRS